MKSSDGGPRKQQWGEIISELEFLFSYKMFWKIVIEIIWIVLPLLTEPLKEFGTFCK